MHLYLLSIHTVGTYTGVDRHIEILMKGLSKFQGIRLYHLNFLVGKEMCFLEKKTTPNGEIWNIPYPENSNQYISQESYGKTFYKQVVDILSCIFERKRNRILYIHTLNLISFAEVVQDRFKVKIITQLHCIPWRQKINTDLKDFEYICKYGQNDVYTLICSEIEWKSYQKANQIICVTHSGALFLHSLAINTPINIVYNGIEDKGIAYQTKRNYDLKTLDEINFIFVGHTNIGKGLSYVVKALTELHRFCNKKLILHFAGSVDERYTNHLKKQNPQLIIKVYGILSEKQLQDLYTKSDIGLIGSLQEQCSYSAIEMMMNGLPIVTTDAVGLTEMFTHGENALVSNIINMDSGAIAFDTKIFAKNIFRIIKDEKLCRTLAEGARHRFLNQFDATKMINKTRKILYATK